MNYERINEILSSPDMIDVTYNGSQVYIDAINESNNTVKIHFIDIAESYLEVPASKLEEQ